ncbi:hypothetical protein [Kangiella marina]|uniref:Uncharacterized protein n=1 Tax=Kangiella marina TaxID=1079178 RepID=A0ABP8IFP1_9GAMM
MSKLTIIAGDFPSGVGRFTIRNFTLPGDENHYLCETVSAQQVTFIDEATEEFLLLLDIDEDTKQYVSASGDDIVFFMVKLKDKRRFIASSDQRTYQKVIKAVEKEANISPVLTSTAA